MGSQDDFFEALGPTPAPPNDSPGFFTQATNIWRGADIAGKQLGVRGTGTGPGAPGIIGEGATGGNGVFGHGMNGVVGLSATAIRNPSTEASEPAGIFGVGDSSTAVGVRGESLGPNAGVVGISHTGPGGVGAGPGVRGSSDDGIGLVGQGDVGAILNGKSLGLESSADSGAGIRGLSRQDFGGVFKSDKYAQVLLIPHDFDPRQLDNSIAGSLAVNTARDPRTGREFAQLWFCRIGGPPGTSDWHAIA
jgi:hypothetical protein